MIKHIFVGVWECWKKYKDISQSDPDQWSNLINDLKSVVDDNRLTAPQRRLALGLATCLQEYLAEISTAAR